MKENLFIKAYYNTLCLILLYFSTTFLALISERPGINHVHKYSFTSCHKDVSPYSLPSYWSSRGLGGAHLWPISPRWGTSSSGYNTNESVWLIHNSWMTHLTLDPEDELAAALPSVLCLQYNLPWVQYTLESSLVLIFLVPALVDILYQHIIINTVLQLACTY